mgnify:CR=1 FL=1
MGIDMDLIVANMDSLSIDAVFLILLGISYIAEARVPAGVIFYGNVIGS